MIPRIVIAILITVCVIPPTRGSEAETKQGSLPSPPGDAQQKAPKATLTPKQLRELLKDYRKLTTLSIEYSINMRPGSASADYSQSGVHRRIVAKAPCFFYHDSGHATESIDWQDDPYRQMCYFDKNQETITYALNRSFAQRSYGADKPLDGTMATEFFSYRRGYGRSRAAGRLVRRTPPASLPRSPNRRPITKCGRVSSTWQVPGAMSCSVKGKTISGLTPPMEHGFLSERSMIWQAER